MSDYGFVYVLLNPSMTGFKIGCTERSPHARAAQLSAATGVPEPFNVAFYVDASQFHSLERDMHRSLEDYRVWESREFFHNECLREAIGRLYWDSRVMARTTCWPLLEHFCRMDGQNSKSAEEIITPRVDYEELPPLISPPRGFRAYASRYATKRAA